MTNHTVSAAEPATVIEKKPYDRTRVIETSAPEKGLRKFTSYTRKRTVAVTPAFRTEEKAPREEVGPIFVQDPSARKQVSYLEVVAGADYEDRTLFWVLGAELSYTTSDRSRSRVILRHTFAGDVENDRAYLFILDIASLELINSWHGYQEYNAWITKAHYYGDGDDGAADRVGESSRNIFDALVKEEEDPEKGGDWYANSGYPYMPPQKTEILGRKTPLQVRLKFYTGADAAKRFRKLVIGKGNH